MAGGPQGWEIELCPLGADETALDELAEDLTKKQLAQVVKQLGRLEQHGRQLGPSYFGKLACPSRRLWEFRLSVADNTEVRFVFVQEGRTFYFLRGFKHHGEDDVRHHIPIAERRMVEWGV